MPGNSSSSESDEQSIFSFLSSLGSGIVDPVLNFLNLKQDNDEKDDKNTTLADLFCCFREPEVSRNKKSSSSDRGSSKPDSEPANFFSSLNSARERFNTNAEWAFGNLQAVAKLATDFCCCRREEKEKESANDAPTVNGNRPRDVPVDDCYFRLGLRSTDRLTPAGEIVKSAEKTTGKPAPRLGPQPPLAQAKPLVKPDAPFTESFFYSKWHWGGAKLNYDLPTGELLKAVDDFILNAENADAINLFNNFLSNNSNTKDLIIYQYEMARKQIEMGEWKVNLSESQIKLLKEYYPKGDFYSKINGKNFLQGKLGRITAGLNDNTKPIVIEDKIIRLNLAIAIIDGRQTELMTPATYCGVRLPFACLSAPKQRRGS